MAYCLIENYFMKRGPLGFVIGNKDVGRFRTFTITIYMIAYDLIKYKMRAT